MKLVEVVRTIATSDETVDGRLRVRAVARQGADPHAATTPGFVVNRLLVPYLLDAVRALEEGVGTREDIDKGMELGCGHPMGPLKLLDFVGLDTTYAIAEIMFDEYREKRFAPPPLLKRMVLAGPLRQEVRARLLRVRRGASERSGSRRDPRAESAIAHGRPSREAERAERGGPRRPRARDRRGARRTTPACAASS